MGRKSKLSQVDDPVFVREHLRKAADSLQRMLGDRKSEGAPEVEAATTSFLKVLDVLQKPQVDEVRVGISGHTARLEALEEQMTNVLAALGFRNLKQQNQGRPSMVRPPVPPGPPPQYQGPSQEELREAQRAISRA